jgi:hypothetical protein
VKVIIAGSRSIIDMSIVLKAIQQSHFNITEVVCGEAKGADTLGKEWAKSSNIPIKSFPANWYRNGAYNPKAGFERNHIMGDYADAVICIWDGQSGGTKDMFTYMKKIGKPCYIHKNNFVDLFDLTN